MRVLAVGLAASLLMWAEGPEPIPMEWRGAINRISPESLKGHVSFLASDLLEGRATPSRGQDIAAAYIAAQFRRFGLKAGGGKGYFQDAPWAVPQPSRASGPLVIGDLTVDPSEVEVFTREDVDVTGAEAVVWTGDSKPDLENKVAVFVVPDSAPEELMGEAMGFLRAANRAKAKRLVIVDPRSMMRSSAGIPRPYKVGAKQSGSTATAFVYSQKVAEAIRAKAGQPFTVSMKAPANATREFPMRNVVGVLPGTDPVLRDTYIVISAHYDHIGMGAGGDDRVFNGANDDASGVADMLEIAEALAVMPVHPKRSIVFVAFAGEEQGLHGSREFANSGLFAPAKIVANFNLEVTGRLDAEQAVAGAATITGMEYSSLGGVLERAGKVTDVKVMGDAKSTDAFFSRSDNISLASKGVPAVTISSGYIYPDYHGLKDEWDKLDYPQMAAIARLVTASALMLADTETAPSWMEISATEPYRKARDGAATSAGQK